MASLNQDDVICTQMGMVSLSDLAAHQKDSNHHPATGLCTFCMPLMHAGLDGLAVQPVLGEPSVVVGQLDQTMDDQAVLFSAVLGLSHGPRAPPVFS